MNKEIVTRIDVLLRAKEILKNKECICLCKAIYVAMQDFGIAEKCLPIARLIKDVFPLYTFENARRFFASIKTGGYWWRPCSFGVLSGRRMFLNWLIWKYRNDKTNLNDVQL